MSTHPRSDGERFLMDRPYVSEGQGQAGYVLIQNFFELLKQRMGGS